ASELQREFGQRFPLIQASAEAVPLRDACADVVLSEYGASIWCDPHVWVREAARLLRPGGELVLLKNATLLVLCMREWAPAASSLERPLFGLDRLEWADQEGAVNFDLSWGAWIALFRAAGFEIIDLIELRAPEGATSRFDFVTAEWARQWPSEEIWR